MSYSYALTQGIFHGNFDSKEEAILTGKDRAEGIGRRTFYILNSTNEEVEEYYIKEREKVYV